MTNAKVKRSYIPPKHQPFWNEKKERDLKAAELRPLFEQMKQLQRLWKSN